MLILAELNFAQTVAAGLLNSLFTAVFVGIIAALVVKIVEQRSDRERLTAEQRHEDAIQVRQLEHQTRATLRDTYAQLLVAQRRSRQTSLRLAKAGGASGNKEFEAEALSRHDEFIDLYHRLNLDASRQMWEEARGLRHVLDEMLRSAKQGDEGECTKLADYARSARQNLERVFRLRLGYEEPLQERRNLGSYDKTLSAEKKIGTAEIANEPPR